MQPYLLPYLGYFQLMASVDVWVGLTDVQYMKGGWINRNRILLDGKPAWLTLPVNRSPLDTSIRDKRYIMNAPTLEAFNSRVRHAYANSAGIGLVERVLSDLMRSPTDRVADVNLILLQSIFQHTGRSVPRQIDSHELGIKGQRGVTRVISICKRLGATTYVNLPGGRDLYQTADFERSDIALEFIDPRLTAYPQPSRSFVPALSVLDAIANDPNGTHF